MHYDIKKYNIKTYITWHSYNINKYIMKSIQKHIIKCNIKHIINAKCKTNIKLKIILLICFNIILSISLMYMQNVIQKVLFTLINSSAYIKKCEYM